MAGRGKASSGRVALNGLAATTGNGLASSRITGGLGGDGFRLEQFFGSEQLFEIQRMRLLVAMVGVACEYGASNVTVAHVVERAGVSRRTFYELYSDCEDCLLAALDDAIVRVSGCVVSAYGTSGRWRERVRAGLGALLGFLDKESCLGRFLFVESLAAGPRALERRAQVIAQIATVVDAGRRQGKASESLPSLTAEGVVGAVFSVIHGRMLKGDEGSLVKLTNPLMSMIVMPYLGLAAARNELERPVPRVRARYEPVSSNPLRDLEMRLTYRTTRVLVAVAANPGSSNRVIADASDIGDQGQMSKLLGRLERLGLIENTDVGSASGPNAWSLTGTGLEVHGVLTAQARI